MRKNPVIVLILLTAMIIITACGNNPVFAPQEQKIKSVTKWLIDKKTEDKIAKISYKEFDKTGHIILNEEYSPQGFLTVRRNYSYDDNLKIEFITEFTDNQVAAKSKNIYFINSRGQVTIRISLNEHGDTTEVMNYFYYDNGKLKTEVTLDKDGKLIDKKSYVYNYNEGGYVTGRLVTDAFNSDNFVRDSIIYTPSARQVDQIVYNSADRTKIIYTYIYDNSGNVRKEIHSDQNGVILRKYLYEYIYFF